MNTKNPVGRPSKRARYRKADYERIEEMYASGQTDEQVATNLGVNWRTVMGWADNEDSEFFHSRKRGKERGIDKLEKALFRRAEGYEVTETKELVSDSDGRQTKRIERITKHVPPDVASLIFFLTNRRKTQWVNRQRQEVTGEDGKAIEVDAKTVREFVLGARREPEPPDES